MCDRHSFLLDREGRVYDGYGITHSHTEIATMHGFKGAEADALNAYEWQPPEGWPKSSFLGGLTVDRQNFAPKQTHDRAIRKYLLTKFPDLAAWEAPEQVDPAIHGKTVVLYGREYTAYCYGSYTVTEGRYWAYGSASVRAYGSASVRASGSASVRAYDSASVEAYGSASVRASGSASVEACDSASVRASGSASVEAYGSASVMLSEHYSRDISATIADNAVVIDRMGGGVTVFSLATIDALSWVIAAEEEAS